MKSHQGGVALVLVLWVITLLTVIAANFAFSMRGEAHITRNLLFAAQAQAQADGGVWRAVYELLKPPGDAQRWQGNGLVHQLNTAEAELLISILDESGKIDLNAAPEDLLKGLFLSVGIGQEAAVSLADAIVDWRDPDKLKRLHGAEETEYRAAGKEYVPSNAPFETLDELQRVMGMTPELYRKLAQSLTVYSRQQSVNALVAPREVLLAIPGIGPALVEQYVAQRQSQLLANQRVAPLAFSSVFINSSSLLRTFTVRSEAKMSDGTVFVRQSVVRMPPDAGRPFIVLAWGEGGSEPMMELR
jgi:general secretion pathway protein K